MLNQIWCSTHVTSGTYRQYINEIASFSTVARRRSHTAKGLFGGSAVWSWRSQVPDVEHSYQPVAAT
ncbi:MAG: hypothetical protein ACI9TF_001923 [Paracrocinitomix sp.]|jgi:hypothetical protein